MGIEVCKYPAAELEQNLAQGEMAPYDGLESIRYIDCGDKRFLTPECQAKRQDLPVRYLGGGCGLALTAINAFGMQSDAAYREVREVISEYEDGVIGLASHISDAATREELGIRVYLHSAESVEQHPRSIRDDCDEDVGCALMANAGGIIGQAGKTSTAQITRQVLVEHGEINLKDSVYDAIESTKILLPAVGGESFKIGRQPVLRALRDPNLKTPVAMVRGIPKITDTTSVILDLAGYKIAADGKNYAHSIPAAEQLLQRTLPGFKLEKETIRASGIVLGVATLQKLGVGVLKVLSAETTPQAA